MLQNKTHTPGASRRRARSARANAGLLQTPSPSPSPSPSTPSNSLYRLDSYPMAAQTCEALLGIAIHDLSSNTAILPDSTAAVQMQASPAVSSQPFEMGLSFRGVTSPSGTNISTSSTSLGHHSGAAAAYKYDIHAHTNAHRESSGSFVCQVSPPTPLSDFMHESPPVSVLDYPNMFVPDYTVDSTSGFDSLQFTNADTPVSVASLSMSPLGTSPLRSSGVQDSYAMYDQSQQHHQHPSSMLQYSRDQWNMSLPIPRSSVYHEPQKMHRSADSYAENKQMVSPQSYSDLSKPLDLQLHNLDGSIPTSHGQYGLSTSPYPQAPYYTPVSSLPTTPPSTTSPTFPRAHIHTNSQSHHRTPSSGSPSPSALSEADLRSKPQCWDHGCNGRSFSTFSNLLRHQREKAGLSVKAECPYCGAAFTRSTARNGHLERGRCKAMREE